MALEEYKRKRDFRKTPEPPAEKPQSRKGFSYLIQKHDATRLHYDLRLELDGVLLSWAVTKGPSLYPGDKRLAVRTEDHPLSYGKFEGTIPQGGYGGGTVMLWDRGSWEPREEPHRGLQKGHLAFNLYGERLRGAWDLVRMHGKEKKENWLLIKVKDDEARDAAGAAEFLKKEVSSVTTRRSMDEIAVDAPAGAQETKSASKAIADLVKKYPHVELASLASAPPEGDQWLHEIKFDGYRLLAFCSDGEVRLQTRNGNDWTRKFPTIYASVAKMKMKSAVLDMEAVVLDRAGKSSFQAMQHALGDGGNRQLIQAYIFDLLYLDGRDLTRELLVSRKKTLEKLLKKSKDGDYLRYSDHVAGHGREMLEKSCSMGLEGVISKLANSAYRPGRQKSWLKAKCIQRQEFVIIGYTAARTGPRAIGALHLGYNQNGELKYAGKVGTGFGMKDAQELYDRLAQLSSKTPAVTGLPRSILKSAHWVRPEMLCEVSFTEWTEDGHIRHPSFQGLREDKKPQEVVMEKPVVITQTRSAKRSAPAASRAEKTKARAAEKPAGQNSEKQTANGTAKQTADRIDVLGVSISHPGRVIFKEVGVTKGELAEYYGLAAPWILKDIAGHPVTLLRCPEGIAGECFYQRNAGTGLGADVKSFRWRHKGKSYEYLYIDDEKGLIEFVQMGAIELHPWGARVAKIDYPDRLIFDLDPDESVPFDAVKLAARDLRRRLDQKGLESYLKTTGGKGLHVTVRLAEKDNWGKVKGFAASVAEEMVRDVPVAYVATMTKAKRTGKIFVDYFRNDYTATAIADFAVRARPGAPVAVPLEWKELDKLQAANQFSIRDVVKRLKKYKPEAGRYGKRQKLPA
jgi:bifunctional non-homologous end joining protein LigD